MSAAATYTGSPAREQARSPIARRIVFVAFGVALGLAFVLVAASFLPTRALATRMLGSAGVASSGGYAQELVSQFSARLRFAGVLLFLLGLGVGVMRASVEELITAGVQARVTRWPSRRTLLLLSVPMLVGLGLRLAFLQQPMRYDEAFTFNEFASKPLYYGLAFYPVPNNHLLNTLLMHLAFVAFGNQPWGLRLPVLLGGILLVPSTYGLGRLIAGPGAALLAAALVAASSYLVEYSTNARGYILQTVCFCLMLSLAIVAVRRRSPGALLAAVGVATLGAYAVPTMLYGVAIVGVWLVIEVWRWSPGVGARHLVAAALVLGLLVSVLYLPVIIVSGPDSLAQNRFVVPLGPAEFWDDLSGSLVRTWGFWNRDIVLPLAALLVVGFAIETASHFKARRVPLGLLAPLVCLVLVALQRVAPFERVWLFLLPLYFVIASAGLARFVDGRLLALVFGGVIGFTTLTSGSILASAETGAFPEAEAVTQTLASRLAPDDAVVTEQPTSLPELQYYFPRYGLPINVLVRTPDEAQNLWVIALPGDTPALDGWPNVQEMQRFSGATLFELRRLR